MVPDGTGRTRSRLGARYWQRRRGNWLALRNERGDRDRTAKSNRRPDGGCRGLGCRRGDPGTLRSHGQPFRLEAHDDSTVAVGPQDTCARSRQSIQRDPGGVAVRIACAGRRDRNRRLHRVDERLGRCRSAAMVRNLEQVDTRQSRGEQLGVDGLLDVTHQEKSTGPDLSEKHDRHVVDAGAAVGWLERDLASSWPEHPERDLVHGQPVAGGDPCADRRTAAGQLPQPRAIPRTGSAHAGLHNPLDAVPLEEQRESGHMILVRMREDDRIDPSIPWRDALVERHEQPVRIRPTVDQQSSAT